MKLARKLALFFFLVGIVPTLTIGVFSLFKASSGLSTQSFNQLQAIRAIKKLQVENYFAQRKQDMAMLVETIATIHESSDLSMVESLLSTPRSGEAKGFFSKYIENYGYYDVFLINGQGDVFFTEAREADYGTNLVNGPYRNSGLARIFNKALDNRGFVLEDFSPYAPSNNEPASFIAQPIYKNGALVVIVALQLSLDKINSFMQEREGMGETGESYLVGPDNRMRSDSYLDPKGHSVVASFAGSVLSNGVDSDATVEALNGNVGAKIVIDYNGNPVLSAYTPVDVEGYRWALMSEIDEAEAFSDIKDLQIFMAIVIIIATAIVIFVGVLVARSITRPLGGEPHEMKAIADEIAAGNLTLKFEARGKEDSVYSAMNKMAHTLNQMISKIVEASSEIAVISQDTSVITQQTHKNVQHQQQESAQVAVATNEMTASVQEVARNAAIASTSAQTATTEALLAKEVTESSIETIVDMAEAISASMLTIEALEKQSAKIGSVLDVIRSISEQINLLALNAAIEAARAGDNGRGFAVVADEVRSLAQKTKASTTDIESMIRQLQAGANKAVHMMELSAGKSQTNIEMANKAGAAINQINAAVDAIKDMNAQIASAADQQSAVSEEINISITHISDLSQHTADGAQQIANATLRLAKLSGHLSKLVDKFRVS